MHFEHLIKTFLATGTVYFSSYVIFFTQLCCMSYIFDAWNIYVRRCLEKHRLCHNRWGSLSIKPQHPACEEKIPYWYNRKKLPPKRGQNQNSGSENTQILRKIRPISKTLIWNTSQKAPNSHYKSLYCTPLNIKKDWIQIQETTLSWASWSP